MSEQFLANENFPAETVAWLLDRRSHLRSLTAEYRRAFRAALVAQLLRMNYDFRPHKMDHRAL